MQIFAKTETGRRITLELEAFDTIEHEATLHLAMAPPLRLRLRTGRFVSHTYFERKRHRLCQQLVRLEREERESQRRRRMRKASQRTTQATLDSFLRFGFRVRILRESHDGHRPPRALQYHRQCLGFNKHLYVSFTHTGDGRAALLSCMYQYLEPPNRWCSS